MKRITFVGLAMLLTAATPAERSGKTGVDKLSWMSGVWSGRQGHDRTEERWSPPKAGVMLGTNLTVSGSSAKAYEFLRIAADDKGRVIYWSSPQGRQAVPFELVAAAPNEAVFENPKHDYPTRISYRREGNRMAATISGPGGSSPMSWNFRLTPD